MNSAPIEPEIFASQRRTVLVQREMESGRAPLASITPIPRGQFAPPEAWRSGGRVPAAETATGFIRKEIRLAGLIHSRPRSVAGNNWLGKEYRTHALPSSSISSRAGAITPARSCCGKLQPKRRRACSFRIGRHPAAIRTGTATTWLQGGQCTRGCVRDRVGLANGKYCANYTPMLSEQSACRMISRSSFPDRELLD
jgi:hypothetical protein